MVGSILIGSDLLLGLGCRRYMTLGLGYIFSWLLSCGLLRSGGLPSQGARSFGSTMTRGLLLLNLLLSGARTQGWNSLCEGRLCVFATCIKVGSVGCCASSISSLGSQSCRVGDGSVGRLCG